MPDKSSHLGLTAAQILENAAGVVGSQADVGAQFDQAVDNGFNVVRIFGFGTQGGFALQSSQVGLTFQYLRCSVWPVRVH